MIPLDYRPAEEPVPLSERAPLWLKIALIALLVGGLTVFMALWWRVGCILRQVAVRQFDTQTSPSNLIAKTPEQVEVLLRQFELDSRDPPNDTSPDTTGNFTMTYLAEYRSHGCKIQFKNGIVATVSHFDK